MFEKYDRTKFCNILEKYWSRFSDNWDVLLHGSPAVDIYNGMKLAAGGELGMGVGEEEWGSGERLVLEDFVQKTEGLVDFMVSRFGEPSPLQDSSKFVGLEKSDDLTDQEPWVGSGRTPAAADGIVFSGVGAITRRSLRDMSQWIETIYSQGDHAYGVGDNPTRVRKKRRRGNPSHSTTSDPNPDAPTVKRSPLQDQNTPITNPVLTPSPNIPPDLIKSVETSLNKASNAVGSSHDGTVDKQEPLLASLGDSETWMKYLTLGYGTTWGSKKAALDDGPSPQMPTTDGTSSEPPMRYVAPEPDIDHAAERLKTQIRQENRGYFAIGLKGDLGDGNIDDTNSQGDWNHRTLLRTVHVELCNESYPQTPGIEYDTPPYEKELSLISLKNAPVSRLSRLRPVIYVVRTTNSLRIGVLLT